MATISVRAALQPLGVIWLHAKSAIHKNPPPKTTQNFLDVVRVELAEDGMQVFDSTEIIWATPDKDRPTDWVILLDPHTEFRDMTDLMNDLDRRIPELLAREAGDKSWRATVALCSPLFANFPSSTPLAIGHEGSFRQAEPSFRRNDFYAHVLVGYQWGEVIRADRLAAFLTRVNTNRHLLRLSDVELRAWRGDVDRLWNSLASELKRWSLHPNFFFGLKDRPDRFLDSLARIYELGRWEKKQAEKFLHGVDNDGQEEPFPLTHTAYTGVAWLDKAPGLFALRENLNELHDMAWKDLQANGGVAVIGPTKNDENAIRRLRDQYVRAARRNKITARIELYGTLRDMSRSLARGAAQWAATSREVRNGREQPVRVLAIKDMATNEFKQTLRTVFDTAFRSGHVYLDCLSATDNDWNRPAWWVQKIEQNELLSVDSEHPSADNRPASDNATRITIRTYDIILLDVQYDTQFLGSQLVQWLDAQFEGAARRAQEAHPEERARRPYLFVLSRFTHFGYMHQCMNHGAEAVISKGRLYSLPQMLTAARVGRKRLLVEPRHSKPNFRSLYSLLPRAVNRLRSDQTEDMVLGDEYDRPWVEALPKADLHFHIGTSISYSTVEALAVNTAGYFFQGIAPNQSWHAGRNGVAGAHPPGVFRSAEGAEDLVRNICRIVVVANVLVNWPDIPIKDRLDPPESLWTAARYVLLPRKSPSQVIDPIPPTNDIFDQVVEWLTPRDKPNNKFETCGLLVAAISVFERLISEFRGNRDLLAPVRGLAGGGSPGDEEILRVAETTRVRIIGEFQSRWQYFDRQATTYPIQFSDPKFVSAIPINLSGPLGGELGVMFDYYIRRVRSNWHDEYTEDRVVSHGPDPARKPGAIWAEYSERIKARVKAAVGALVQTFTKLLLDQRWHAEEQREFKSSQAKPVLLPEIGEAIAVAFGKGEILAQFVEPTARTPLKALLTLHQLVVLPQVAEPRLRTLPRYLWGAGLLGAEHMQYPENLLLATWDLVRQNVRDNVVYSEVRCSTNGYCDGGMNVYDATDLLCLGFDMAAAYHGVLEPSERGDGPEVPRRWVRTNVLLGAKRHKRLSDTRDVVALLQSYIRRGSEIPVEVADTQHRPAVLPGRWWARCRVVGFDLSGDEKNQDPAVHKKLEELIEPLFVDCTPITIHAGEAATADSIWYAVHRYGAQRIGHGLRLRENKRLLTHCINRGICMELCPISNDFTNIFDAVRAPDDRGRGYVDVPLGRREVYPLRHFLDEGLDVCLNTDNRFLHPLSTLTDEYLRAAKLVGGLTRWEILKVAKSGFKHAFLAKDEKAVLLRHVEFEVYKLTTDEPGELDFPPPGEPAK